MFVRVIPVPKISLKSGKSFLEISAVFITWWGDTSLDKSFLYSHFFYTTSAGFIKSKILNPPDCIILDNRVFENFVLADDHLQKLYKVSKLVYQFKIV